MTDSPGNGPGRLSVRALGPEDVDDWRRLRTEGLRLFPGAFLITLQEAEAAERDTDLAAMARGGRFGVFDGARAIGIGAIRCMGLSRIRHRAELGPFYVSPQAQGSGAARLLLDALLDHARAMGALQVELYVAGDNPRAIAFYERHGFARCGTVPRAVIMPEGPVDDLFYVRMLDGEAA
ncbi:GNAT family N-acetyltransferase [Seohaeicola zhoushanensis]|uniref:N-acetyltransferase n=1 Tax=Seohaeicola zhoushanensis TaxID=1569283 RepID=A0A8J3H3P4_9RHOB|nr:GNAT family N-acetyltransferase [Seohaeicola zhoushanensis]GHF73783.1 N-acetyltransferase [Seohaeicola zhoushanensis]